MTELNQQNQTITLCDIITEIGIKNVLTQKRIKLKKNKNYIPTRNSILNEKPSYRPVMYWYCNKGPKLDQSDQCE